MKHDRFGAVAGRVIARLAKQVELAIGPEDLSLPQYRVLGLLAEGEEASSRLAEQMAVRPHTVTSIVDGLVGRGLVSRGADPADRRRLPLSLTDDGRAALERANTAVGGRLVDVLAHVGTAERATLKASIALWQRALDTRLAERRTRKASA